VICLVSTNTRVGVLSLCNTDGVAINPVSHQLCVEYLLAQSEQLAFAQLSSAEAKAIADLAHFQHWPDGSILSEFGTPLATAPFYLLLEGNVAVQIALPGRRLPIVANVEVPGCIFGTDALFMPTQRYAQYVADGDVVCALFTAKGINDLAKRRPELAYKLAALVGASVFRSFRTSVKRLAIDASMQLSEKEQFEGELKAAQHRAKVALAMRADASISSSQG
jgi:CRP-like cAMP-binding protein